jgi:hypothetical protein
MPRECKDWIDAFMRYTDHSEPPVLYKMWTAITTIAAVLERKCYLEWGELTFYPNMYVVLVGPSGKCRKGTAMGVGARMLREIGKTKMAAEAVTRESLIRALKEAEEQQIDVETGEVTFHSSLTIFSPELTVFLGYHNLQLISDITDWYDCRDHWTYRTKNMGTDDITGVWVNLFGATTPDLIRSAIPQDAIGGGLSSRIIFVYEEEKSKTVADPFLSKDDLILREKLVNDLERIHTMRGKFHITEELLEKWIAWYEYQDANPPFVHSNFMGYVYRRPNHILKLCMVLSASSRDDMVIDSDTFDRALSILERTERKMLRTFSGMGRSSRAEINNKIMETIAIEQSITTEKLMRLHMADLEDTREFGAILTSLQAIGFCRYDPVKGIVTYREDNQIPGFGDLYGKKYDEE